MNLLGQRVPCRPRVWVSRDVGSHMRCFLCGLALQCPRLCELLDKLKRLGCADRPAVLDDDGVAELGLLCWIMHQVVLGPLNDLKGHEL